MAGHYAEDRWLWAHLWLLAVDGGEQEVGAILERLTPVELMLLVLAGFDTLGLAGRDVKPLQGWLAGDRQMWAEQMLSDLWRRSMPRD